MVQKQTQGQQKQGQAAPQSGQQNWNERKPQNPNRDPAEGSRQMPGSSQPGTTPERGRTDKDTGGDGDTGGITNRDLGSEMDEQEELPERGTDESER